MDSGAGRRRNRPAPIMRLIVVASLLLVFLPGGAAADSHGEVSFVFPGIRQLDESFHAPLDQHDVFGVTAGFGPDRWPVRFALSAFQSRDEGRAGLNRGEGRAREISFGIVHYWKAGRYARPYAGGGAAVIDFRAEVRRIGGGASASDNETTIGGYLQAGILFRLSRHFNIGVDLRTLQLTSIRVLGVDGDVNYTQAGLAVGWGWPGRR